MITRQTVQDTIVLKMQHGKVNALDSEFLDALTAAIGQLESEGAPPFVLTGDGRTFSAGVDLQRIVGGGAEYVKVYLPKLERAIDALFRYRGPVVGALNGHAIAGGCILACCCDYRVTVTGGARAGMPELLVGVPIPALAFEIVRGVTPDEQHFKKLVYMGAMPASEEAVAFGIADECVGPEELLNASLAALKKLQNLPRSAFEITKQQMQVPVRERVALQLQKTEPSVAKEWLQPHTYERIQNYLNSLKR